jgi:hypothetical protein
MPSFPNPFFPDWPIDIVPASPPGPWAPPPADLTTILAALAARDTREAAFQRDFLDGVNLGPQAPVFWRDTSNTRQGAMLADGPNKNFVAIDTDMNGKYDTLLSPPWTNLANQVMTNPGNGWALGWHGWG